VVGGNEWHRPGIQVAEVVSRKVRRIRGREGGREIERRSVDRNTMAKESRKLRGVM
jgi:hypothetical protein